MKYLKRYKIFESFDIEDLADYLQETFDKFGIRKRPDEDEYEDIDNPTIEWYTVDDIIIISNIPTDDKSPKSAKKIRSELKRIQPILEKRIKERLVFSIGQNGYVPSICWIRIDKFTSGRG